MSNWCPFVVLLSALPCAAQSPALLDAVRTHKAGVERQAAAELERCEGTKPKACAERGSLALLTGVLTLSANDAPGAASVLERVAAPKGLEAIHAWYFAQALAYAGDAKRALAQLQKIGDRAPRWLTKRARPRQGELLLRLGQPKKALPLLDAWAKADGAPEALWARASANVRVHKKADALTDLTRLLVRFPAHPHAALAAELRQALGDVAPLSDSDRLARSSAWLSAGEPKAALKDLEGIARGDEERAAQVALIRGQALLALGKEAEALAALSQAERGDEATAAEAVLIRARRLLRNDAHDDARSAFLDLERRFPTSSAADEAGYFAAWVLLQDAKDLEAAQAFADFETKHPSSRRLDEARWFRGYALYRAGQAKLARAVLTSLADDFPRSSLVPQARYWAARCREVEEVDGGVDGGASATAEYAALVKGAAGTFYATLAVERLEARGAEVPPIFSATPAPLRAEAVPALALALQLSRAGLFRDAQDEVQQLLSSVGPADAARYARALQAHGDFGNAHALAARHLWGATYAAQAPEVVGLMYPQAFADAVSGHARAARLDPHFAWAIMRRESAFRPHVTSSADARGLMQIIPPTARAIATRLSLPEPDPAELYAPDLNVRLGTWYLSALLERFGHPALAAAAYNAGPSNVLRWLTARGTLPLDRFVEEIPFKETRGYVKQVLADYAVYQRLYGSAVKPLALVLPKPKPSGVEF